LPTGPGVYLFKDEEGKVIYVGKAANLSNRARSYFGSPSSLSSKVQHLVSRIKELEFVITDSEQEALILECSMIKKYRPRYNMRLKDDKTFPYLRIDTSEDWPAVHVTRRFRRDGARYFGPFASASSVRKTLRLIKRIFLFRSCTKTINGKASRPCLNYYIHRCLGPCIGAVSKQEYQELINQVILFLEGKQDLVLRELNSKMRTAAQQLEYEKAALLRDQIHAVERVIEGQRIAVTLKGDQDVIALAQSQGEAYVELFFIRGNKIVGRDHFIMEGVRDETPGHIMSSFIKQYYASVPKIPRLILLQYPADETTVLAEWLRREKRRGVRLQVPRRGAKKQLMNMVAENAVEGLRLAKAKQVNPEAISWGLQQLKDKLCLPRIPLRIEAYDVSNIQGTLAVGSMAVLKNGLPSAACYRRFRIRTVAGANDYAMIQEVLKRRLKRSATSEGNWAVMPDLILIDGGKGQLNAALEAMKEIEAASIPVASLAKQNEDVFLPGASKPVDITKDSPALHLLQRARDEAHRFAISYHRGLRRREGIASALDDIPGIGARRKKALLKRFISIEAIREASPEELSQAEGVPLALAKRIKEYL
jgi:excinuclease ABC subunit C